MGNKRLHTVDNQLLTRIAQGSVPAFEQFFRENYPAMHHLAKKLTGSGEEAGDIVSDIFMQLWENRASLPPIQNTRAYLYTLTKNRTFNYLKKAQADQSRVYKAAAEPWMVPSSGDALQHILDTESIRLLRAAVQTLPTECAKVVQLGLEGHTTSEIAAILGISTSAVSHQKARAIKLLSQKVIPQLLLVYFLLAE